MNKKIKKITLSLISIIFLITLTGCSQKGETNETTIESKTSQNNVTEETQTNSNTTVPSCH